jgi:hypothetical protein
LVHAHSHHRLTLEKEQVSFPPAQLTGYTWEKEMNQNLDMYEVLIIIV